MYLILLYWTSSMGHKSFVIADGPAGNNGKSTLRRIITSLAPKFQSSLNKGLIIQSKRGKDSTAATNELTNLGNGCRYAFSDELNDEDMLDISTIKEFCGETEMCMRRMYKETEQS